MKFKFKKYIFLINDITNLILKRERDAEIVKAKEDVKKLRTALVFVSVVLFISLIINIILIIL